MYIDLQYAIKTTTTIVSLPEGSRRQKGSTAQPEEPLTAEGVAWHLLELKGGEQGTHTEAHHDRLHKDETWLSKDSVV